MNKTFAVAVLLLGVFAMGFATNKSNGVQAETFLGPRVVATAKVINQTAPIPSTTIFTPPVSGIYRVSSYMAMTTPGTVDLNWVLYLGWTDDVGLESMGPLEMRGVGAPASAYGFTPVAGDAQGFPGAGSSFVLRAVAGTPITYSVTNQGTNGTYELFLVVERLE